MNATYLLAAGTAVALVWAIWGLNPLAGTVNPQALLKTGYMDMETGVVRNPDGSAVVQVLTRMPGVKADMVRWWFCDYMQTTEHYKMWHPEAHVWMDWENKAPGEIVGASHLVHEYIGGELDKLRITFIDPVGLFGSDPNTEDRFVICALPGPLDEPVRFGRMTHIVRDTSWGAEMRSCFWLGEISSEHDRSLQRALVNLVGNTNVSRRLVLKKEKAAGLMQHCIEEMGTLSDFLPQLYYRETGKKPTEE